jgi:short-chain Z-isoprenyl diphosphate synthase
MECARPRLSDPYGGADKHVNLRDNLRRLLVRVYTRRVEGHLDHDQVPKHIGVIVDGNRRWAKAAGSTTAQGHKAGADKIEEFLGWCSETDVEVVTLWLLSTDNLTRPQEELAPLLGIIENVVTSLAADGRWRVHHVGNLDLLPGPMQTQIKEAEEATAHVTGGILVNVAIAYGGRQEIADAVRSMMLDAHDKGTSLEELAENVDIDMIGKHLYTSDQPDPDLVIRTSGEQRLSGFMLWQTAHSEYYFCEVFWPAFRKVDFLRALRDYAARHRRYGN